MAYLFFDCLAANYQHEKIYENQSKQLYSLKIDRNWPNLTDAIFSKSFI